MCYSSNTNNLWLHAVILATVCFGANAKNTKKNSAHTAPVILISSPKSGTHLLAKLVDILLGTKQYVAITSFSIKESLLIDAAQHVQPSILTHLTGVKI